MNTEDGGDAEECIMEDFPAGYELYDHHNGPPGGAIRHDLYLYGKLSSTSCMNRAICV